MVAVEHIIQFFFFKQRKKRADNQILSTQTNLEKPNKLLKLVRKRRTNFRKAFSEESFEFTMK